MHPKIASNIDAGLDKSKGQLHFVFVNSREELVLDADSITVKLVDLMDGTRSVCELADAVGNAVSELEIGELVDFLCKERILIDARTGRGIPRSISAYERQIEFFADFTANPIEVQKKMCGLRVGILGLGTIGGMIAGMLCRMGIGGIHAVDPDTVSASNLARHDLFIAEDVGKTKVDAAGRALRGIRPELEYRGKQRRVRGEADLEELIVGCDLLINCADQPSVAQTSEWLGRACMRTGTPHILAGGYRTHLGFLGPTIIPFETACWKCFADDYAANDPFGKLGWQPLASTRISGGSLMPLAGMIASLHAWEAIRILTGILPPIMVNRKAELNYVDLSFSWYEVKRNPECTVCGNVNS